MDLHFTMYGRDIKFSMTYDENFIADQTMLYCLQQFNACEPEVMHLMARVLKPGDFAVDGGANIGFFSLFMAQLVGMTGNVLAFEPAPANRAKLEANIRLNKANVSTDYRPLWSARKAPEMFMYVAEDSGVNSLRPNDQTIGSILCETTTLWGMSDYVPRLIKLDIEGAEQHALEGLGDLLGEVPYIVCELNEPALARFGNSQQSLRHLMERHWYETFILPPDGILPIMVPPQTRIVTNKPNLNVLFARIEDVSAVYPEIHIDGGPCPFPRAGSQGRIVLLDAP